MTKLKVFAVYKGDEFITVGTARECAEQLGVTPDYIRWMTYPTCRKRNTGGDRMIAIVVEDDDE